MSSPARLLFSIAELSQMLSAPVRAATLQRWLRAANALVTLIEADKASNEREQLCGQQLKRGVLQAVSDFQVERHVETGAISIPLFNLHASVKRRFDTGYRILVTD